MIGMRLCGMLYLRISNIMGIPTIQGLGPRKFVMLERRLEKMDDDLEAG